MIARHVYLKFKDEFGTDDAIAEVVDETPRMLAGVPQVRGLHIGRPCDERSHEAWDLVLLVEFASADDIEPYRVHPDHVAYYRDYLKPRLEVIKAWNFAF